MDFDDIVGGGSVGSVLGNRLSARSTNKVLICEAGQDTLPGNVPTTFLRLSHYPPQAANAPEDASGSAPHTDHGFITISAQDGVGGLEVRNRDGDWIAAPLIPGTFVVNVADMLARWTNDRWRSTPHRVKNLSGVDRYSCPYFFDMDLECIVACLDSCHGADKPPRYDPLR
jgi:isopenicillin N synthase-like dioxygenase